ncbi:PspC domain-containing protein [Aeromicrobium sp. UC242_57]|uniref:PspC domain-containing protein n=1 Tax=Aeromicrobium sp. UC242_57 TaxID=3374624 RepID=UPI0037BBCDEE
MKKLTRNRDDKWIGGVCSGIADYTGLDTTVVRLLVAVVTIFSAGMGICAYIVAWILMPSTPENVTVWSQSTDVPPTTYEPRPPSE